MFFIRWLSKLPFCVLYKLSDALYYVVYYLVRYRKKVVFENVRRVFPEKTREELTAIAKGCYRNLCDVFVETIKTSALSEDVLKERVRLMNPEVLQEDLDHGRPMIFLGCHMANWEWLLLGCNAYYHVPMHAVYKPLHNKTVDQFLFKVRSRFGSEPIPSSKVVRKTLKRKDFHCLCMLADQSPTRREGKLWYQCLNQDMSFHIGIEKIAHITQYPVYFFALERVSRGHYDVRITKLATPPHDKNAHDIMTAYVNVFEAFVRRVPEQWLWTNRRFKRERPPEEPLQN